MNDTNKKLDAASVRDRILNAKGNFVKAAWKSTPKPKAEFKNILLEKKTVAVVQAGVNYANLSSVKDAIAAGERGEVQELPFGTWYIDPLTNKSWFPYVITHRAKGSDKDEFYLRLYPSQGINHKAHSVFYVDGKEVTKEEFAKYLTNSEANKLLNPNPEDRPLCFTIKLNNLIDLPEEIDG